MIILRYLGKEIYKTMLFTVSVLLLILLTNQLVNLLNRAAMGKIPAETVVQAVLLGIPQYLTYMIPLGIFLGIIVVMGRFSANHELIAMHASGLSKRQLLQSLFLIALPVFAFVALLTFELAPLSSHLEHAVIRKAIMSATLDKVIPGQFQPIAGFDTIFRSEKKHNHTLEDVLFVQSLKKSKSNHLQSPVWDVTRAKTVDQKKVNNATYLVFHNGRRAILQPGAKGAEEFWFKDYGIHTPAPKLPGGLSAVDISTMDLMKRRAGNQHYIAEWQWRFAIPISVLVFVLIAFPLSHVKPRQGKFMRVFPAVMIYAVYVSLLFCSRSWVKAAKVPDWFGLWWVPMLAILLVAGFFLFRHAKANIARRLYA